ncbi:hypothetical protein DFH94DRAFT_708533 [Russula ochroleuca]|uniref:Uncharacterized protein n=1 Tax=Russula ochroleuca TaxID=152965 RepID=A0A9P5TCW9_9AGAM|nr:hypothetical protein DFH94DRAFT_708533 [Russula ochroleuca]
MTRKKQTKRTRGFFFLRLGLFRIVKGLPFLAPHDDPAFSCFQYSTPSPPIVLHRTSGMRPSVPILSWSPLTVRQVGVLYCTAEEGLMATRIRGACPSCGLPLDDGSLL